MVFFKGSRIVVQNKIIKDILIIVDIVKISVIIGRTRIFSGEYK